MQPNLEENKTKKSFSTIGCAINAKSYRFFDNLTSACWLPDCLANQVTNLKALAHTREWFGFIALSRSSLAFFLTRLVQLPAFGESLVSPVWVQSTILQSACPMLRCNLGPTTRGRPTYVPTIVQWLLGCLPQCDSLIASNPSGVAQRWHGGGAAL